MFLDRSSELAFLHSLLHRTHLGPGQFLMMYGRRRVGKTSLLRHWVEQSGLPFTDAYLQARKPRAFTSGMKRPALAAFAHSRNSTCLLFPQDNAILAVCVKRTNTGSA
jgi:AAA+ ATPase superfamily predicted ATPase